jgi:hypothetical protein
LLTAVRAAVVAAPALLATLRVAGRGVARLVERGFTAFGLGVADCAAPSALSSPAFAALRGAAVLRAAARGARRRVALGLSVSVLGVSGVSAMLDSLNDSVP